MSERPPLPEFSPEALEIIKKFKEKDPAAIEAYKKWSLNEEEKNTKIIETRQEDAERINIKFNIKKGKILLAAGKLSEAWECFRQAELSAINKEGVAQDLAIEVGALLDELSKDERLPPGE